MTRWRDNNFIEKENIKYAVSNSFLAGLKNKDAKWIFLINEKKILSHKS